MNQSTASAPALPVDLHAEYDTRRLFFVSILALTTAGMAFAIRTGISTTLEATFLKPIDAANSSTTLGLIMGSYFLGAGFTIAISSPLLDYLGMGRVLGLSALCMILGSLGVVFADRFHVGPIHWYLWGTVFLTGVGAGLIECAINPLVATVYPNDKTHRLNVLHAWWPGGIIIGGLINLGLTYSKMSWKLNMAVILIPAALYGLLLIGARFPKTERAVAGIPASEMLGQAIRPGFLFWLFCMLLTAGSELAPGQWVDKSLTNNAHIKGIWLLVYVSGLMFIMRHFAGPVAHRLSPVGLLWISSLLAGIGLVLLSYAHGPVSAILAATVWGTGVCFMWPTMLAAASERFPRGGATLMGLMGAAGVLSISFVLPQMGKIFDYYKARNPDESIAAAMSFRVVAILPAVLLVVFGAIWMYDKSRGGYAKVREDAARELQRQA